ncbi:zinc transporter ZntB [Xenorhabdus sp. XENO-10]|uniref:Zinc transport protein ZntB n=1 Tax=Xenorhabdus yunnanensis TaxID=3025878 RepID=A0ABT5LGJ4_9GAMM|nr:zinc transporter ZntB [Xenorhabdus yunnanensis]MDC9590222.1 zinc transporter ZntB [Xenorhabdus yunnanensis]
MDTIYGSVFKGSNAIYACQLNGKGGITAFEEDSLVTAEQPVWQHLDYKNPDSHQWLMNTTLLPSPVKEGLVSESIRPKMLRTGEGTLITLRSVNRNDNARPDHLVSFRIYINDKIIISSRHRKIHSIDQVQEDLHNGVGAKSTGNWLIEIAGAITDEVNDFIEELHDNLIELEDDILEQKIPGRGELVLLRKQLIVLRRYMAPQRDVFIRLTSERLPWMSDEERHLMQEIADRLGRGMDDLDGCIARTAVLADEITSMMADAMNRRIYMMSLLTMIFLPTTFLTGLFGVNLGGIPGNKYQFGFGLFSFLLSLLMVVFAWWLRRSKWL